jgi:acyl-CoA thioesterase-1
LNVPQTRKVKATNDAVGGFTSADVLRELSSDADVVSDVANADVVEIEVGANDVGYTAPCGISVGCYQPMITSTQRNLDQIVARVHELTEGRPVMLILLDYWSVWLGGQYANAQGSAYVDAAADVTDKINTVIKQTAADTDSDYVDLRAAFKGPDYDLDETRYLARDGDHPNAAGHQLIAAAVVDAVNQRQSSAGAR